MYDSSNFYLLYTNSFVSLNNFFYYLGKLNDSLSNALGAGPLSDVSEDSDYIHTLLSKNFHVHSFFSNMNAAMFTLSV